MAASDVTANVLKGQVFALNNLKATDAVNVFQGGPSLVCRSDADNTLILFVPFSQAVRLSGLSVSGLADGTAPVTLKLFVNRPALGFEDVGSVEPAQTFGPLTAKDLGDDAPQLKLKIAKFSAVNSLHVYVEAADDAESVAVSKLAFFGSLVQGGGADWSQLKKSEHDHE